MVTIVSVEHSNNPVTSTELRQNSDPGSASYGANGSVFPEGREAAAVISALVDSIPLPTMILSKDLRVVSTSPSLRRLLHIEASIRGQDISDIDGLRAIRRMLQDSIEFLEPREVDIQLGNQRWFHVSTKPYRDHFDRIEGLIVTLSDVQELLENKRLFQEQRDLAHCILNRIAASVVLVDQFGCIMDVNTAFRSLARLKIADLRGWLLTDLVRNLWGEEDIADRMRILQSAEEGSSFVWEHAASHGQKRLCFTGHALRIDGKSISLLFIEDVTRIRYNQQQQTRLAAQLVSQTDEVMARFKATQAELQRLTEHLITSQEDERKRMARELHDDIGQRLSLLAISLHKLRYIDENNELKAITDNLDSINNDLRHISHQMHPVVLEQLGLVTALKTLVEEFGKAESMPVTFSTSGDLPPINESTSIVAYRVTQEALRNVSKHAGKTHVKVDVHQEEQTLVLNIRDDGVGFDEKALESGEMIGLGFTSMRERARLIRGLVTVTSQLGAGTQVTAHLPNPAVLP